MIYYVLYGTYNHNGAMLVYMVHNTIYTIRYPNMAGENPLNSSPWKLTGRWEDKPLITVTASWRETIVSS